MAINKAALAKICAEFEKELTSIVILPILSDISLAVPVLLDRIYKILEFSLMVSYDSL